MKDYCLFFMEIEVIFESNNHFIILLVLSKQQLPPLLSQKAYSIRSHQNMPEKNQEATTNEDQIESMINFNRT